MITSSNKWFVYILQCADQSFYVGATNNLKKRLLEHKIGKGSKFVRSRKAESIIYSEEFNNKYDAYKREREIKGFSRQKKINLIKCKITNAPR